ncbi:ribonuclease HIII [Mycoplasma flocculare]|uniref:Ribonuclease n=1 Tax=Mesomycoplasma flocculare TaxID=2128 RepID=A0AAW9XGQ4_MESFC|nr:ribonuclease HIII [Mesomycoplasma flocculare]MXR39574.1 ribonuclease HIII [Mycoplasma sp. MF12]MXR05944.1 ribonuclease HIII [Mesomycoplasma flocculare]MXR12412.1 ribonuclease HIII [Mesomycoplasma flocculare]MXR56145.1 ribonuclease HIII [Mesomycoplasma flocculare]MXR56767.1 ribonuclease HIII [Mesomycoplasma flocculare]
MILSKSGLYNLNDLVVGCDEVGVGEYFTNLTVCCTVFRENEIKNALLDQIVDSKLLTAKKIADLFKILEKKIKHKFISLEMKEYNQLIQKGLNSHEIKSLLYFKVLNSLILDLKNEKINKIFIDGFVSARKFGEYLAKISKIFEIEPWDFQEFPLILEKKADTKIKQVGAASIIAKYALNQKFAQRQTKWNTFFPAGSNQIEKIIAFCIIQIKKYGKIFLEENVKLHFSITKKILAKLEEESKKNG